MKTTQHSFKRRSRNSKPSNRNGGWKGRSKRNNRQKHSLLDPNSLIKKALPLPESPNAHKRKFTELTLDERLKTNIAKKGYVFLTEIQDKTIELLNSGHDLMGIANTGTGKTGAFLIPVINQLLVSRRHFQTLILVPTRELALKVEEEFRSLTKGLGVYCTSLIGGTSISRDISRLKKMNHVIVGTPGRTIDLINRKALRLRTFSILILDEFDRMLDMGFVNDVMRITDEMNNRKQTVLFSATENNKQTPLINKLLNEPKEIRVSSAMTSDGHVEQNIVRISHGENKFNVLLNMIKQEEFEKVLVFAETKRNVSRLAVRLKNSGILVDEIHSDRSQSYRGKALNKFRSGSMQVLVATDVAARGIDVDDITHVINYQVPQNMESYVHRIGRTGRAGKTGNAITLID